MEATAKFDFMASGEDELSFRTGDILKMWAHAHNPSTREVEAGGSRVPRPALAT
uniref:GRB2-related adaptor protein 2 n=1 Tax=Mus musculus TaxID=10090 RepID=A0A2R8VHI5_MOUSE